MPNQQYHGMETVLCMKDWRERKRWLEWKGNGQLDDILTSGKKVPSLVLFPLKLKHFYEEKKKRGNGELTSVSCPLLGCVPVFKRGELLFVLCSRIHVSDTDSRNLNTGCRLPSACITLC